MFTTHAFALQMPITCHVHTLPLRLPDAQSLNFVLCAQEEEPVKMKMQGTEGRRRRKAARQVASRGRTEKGAAGGRSM